MIEKELDKIKGELPVEVKWISWDNNGFGTLKEINSNEENNRLEFVVEHNNKEVGDMLFEANPDHLDFNRYLRIFRSFSWSIQILRE